MSDLLTALVELIVISFISIMVFDFIIGLVYLARTVQSQSKVQIEPEAITPSAITPMAEPLSPLALPDRKDVAFCCPGDFPEVSTTSTISAETPTATTASQRNYNKYQSFTYCRTSRTHSERV